ncbi:MAG TPA: type VI secretion system tip protein TssI/VgrG, partial [Candidatus Nanopelagicales bacterium]|nr:type VI secretion system tip protein TssI/VgrG [Candidatus Nanopelagicales bacterium]
DAGISYFFRQAEDGATRLVLSDAPTMGEPTVAPLRYVDTPNANVRGAYATSVTINQEVRRGVVRVRDHDLRNPAAEIEAEVKADGADQSIEARLEDTLFRPGISDILVQDDPDTSTPVADAKGARRTSPEEAARIAQKRLAAARAGRRQVNLATNIHNLSPGALFAVAGHPHRLLGGIAPVQLLALESEIVGQATGDWRANLRATPASEPYAPPRAASKPLIDGVQSATVVGAQGETIHTDELGRVRVHFPWDREGKFDDDSSPLLRVGQSWAGTSFGTVQIPRVGQEVLVSFLEGDPNNPVVLASAFNALNEPPNPLPAASTKSSWKGMSPAGSNEITFDDQANQELLLVRASRDLHAVVEGDQTETIEGSRVISVKGDLFIEVKGRIVFQSGRNRHVHVRSGAGGQVRLNSVTLRPGDTGSRVRSLQERLNALGFPVPVTGVFDEATAAAVIAFKTQRKLGGADGAAPDAVVGPTTLQELGQSARAEPPPPEEQRPLEPGQARTTIEPGDRGERVEDLQRRLNRVGDYRLDEDGIYGPATEDAVLDFKRRRGLTGGPAVGPTTLAALDAAAEEAAPPPQQPQGGTPTGQVQTGPASWYGPGFHGRATASGERFDQNALTAAHPSLPFGTRVRVTRVDNGRSVVVRINDRGPFTGGRIIDLSRAAGDQIGLINDGVAQVRVEVLR